MERPAARIHVRELPPTEERFCAWFAEPAGGVLYFGISAFWANYRQNGGDPVADRERVGPSRIGRFDLGAEAMLPALDLGEGLSGVWDVLPVPGPENSTGSVYFTTYFGEAGRVDLATGAVERFEAAGLFLNELTSAGPTGDILVTRYADRDSGGGAVVRLDREGELLASYPLPAPSGQALAAKSVAWDPLRQELWVNSDRLPAEPRSGGGDAGASGREHPHPTFVLDKEGELVALFGTEENPLEIQFVRFDPKGRGYLAVARQGRLELAILEPGAERDLNAARSVLLDEAFASDLDFAQDIQLAADGSAVVTRWSGRIHVVEPDGPVRTLALPRDGEALYYTAVRDGARICATRCDDVEVVCTGPTPKGAGKR